MNFAIISLGCDKATVDSERLAGELVEHGAQLVADPASADVVVVNTCGFIDPAKRESIEMLLRAAALKDEGRVKAVVAVGCLVERYKEDLAEEMDEVDLFLRFSDLPALVPALAEMGLIADRVAAHPGVRQYIGDAPHVRYLKISEGCDHSCSFCAIPLMRGRYRSEPLERLVSEARQLERQGAREICLVAQDLGYYGRDLGRDGPNLATLLKALLQETDVPWYRLLYVYPVGLSDRVVDVLAREPRIVSYIDMPIQHASDRVLERMRRPERQHSVREKVSLLRRSIPDITIRTTVVVGYPGETDEDFRILCDFAEEIEFERLGIFQYSAQEGTASAGDPDDVPDNVKRWREEELGELQRTITEQRLARYVGRETDVLVDRIAEPDEPWFTHVGRVQWQADDVDGVTYVTGGLEAEPGEFVRVVIEGNHDYDFRAGALR